MSNTSFTEEKLRAAYALNLCTVSVSQIVDYNDLGILEQEYEAILNNLNIENMPKDEALLDILKQLLNVITYFRIQEGDKAMLEREYQHNVKNAIWSAVPSFNVIMGGSPLAIATSVASQVGTGYMNYRRTKADLLLSKEKNEWQLQRSAMEQFNGLRRELFETAWRLADTYQFPDEYRLTERQITQYNQILLDRDPLRRYERLLYIADKFQAYPPFHYYIGHAANEAGYPEKAKGHLEQLLNLTSQNILREDQILATCALEYFELFLSENSQPNSDEKAMLGDLLHRASKSAGNANDVLQLCAMSYMRIGDWDNATNLMRMLVNEGYNQIINAQFLSAYYVEGYLIKEDSEMKNLYAILQQRVPQEYLLRLPYEKSLETSEERKIAYEAVLREFSLVRGEILFESYRTIVADLVDQYTVRYNRVRFAEIFDDFAADLCFEDTAKAIAIQEKELKESKSKTIQRNGKELADELLSILNECYEAMIAVPFVFEDTHNKIHACILEQLMDQKEQLEKLSEAAKFSYEQLGLLSFDLFMEKAFCILVKDMNTYLCQCEDMAQIAIAELTLSTYQEKNTQATKKFDCDDLPIISNTKKISWRVFSKYAQIDTQEQDLYDEMFRHIKTHQNDILLPDAKNVKIYLAGSDEFNTFFEAHSKNLSHYKSSTMLVFDNIKIPDEDWLMTIYGLRSYHHPVGVKELLTAGAGAMGASAGFASIATTSTATAAGTVSTLAGGSLATGTASFAVGTLTTVGTATTLLSAASVAAVIAPALSLGTLGFSLLTKCLSKPYTYADLSFNKNNELMNKKATLTIKKLDCDKESVKKLVSELKKIQQAHGKTAVYSIDDTHTRLSERIFEEKVTALAVIPPK